MVEVLKVIQVHMVIEVMSVTTCLQWLVLQ
jgi:hypothetical protein